MKKLKELWCSLFGHDYTVIEKNKPYPQLKCRRCDHIHYKN